jgi:hypothetical protein
MAVYENTLFAKLYRRRLEISIPLNRETERPTQLLELIDVEVAELTLQPANHGFITETIL